MGAKRPHSKNSKKELLVHEAQYRKLQQKNEKPPEQLQFGFDSVPPSREDAKRLVEERRKKVSSEKQPAKSPTIHVAKKRKPPVQHRKARKKTHSNAMGKRRKKGKKRDPMRIEISIPAFVISVAIVAVVIGSLVAFQLRDGKAAQSASFGRAGTVVVEPGMHARQVASLLFEQGIITDRISFIRYLESTGNATRLQPGSYQFAEKSSYADIVSALVRTPLNSTLTIVVYDGYTVQDIDTALTGQGLIKEGDFIREANEIAAVRGLPFTEGWFLSGTYEVGTDNIARNLAYAMQDALNEALRPYLVSLTERDMTIADVIIIASMVQRETNDITQMPLIAGVIYNRLQAGMPVGIDATTRYEMNDWKNPLKPADFESKTPYNTRRHVGLPPTGIGSPSIAAIDAAVRPAHHDWLYYLHDDEGNIHFALTYEEHTKNIEQYL